MRALADAFPDRAFVQAVLAHIPWYRAITLLDIRKPMGVATFTLADVLPEEVRGDLPTIEEIEAQLGE